MAQTKGGPDRVTIRQVAKIAGVSPMTISRALKSPELLSQGTLEHVQNIVRELGYVPDQLARSMSQTESNVVAVIIPRLNNPANAAIFQGLQDGLSGSGLSLFLGTSGSSLEAEERLISDVWGWRPAAIVLCALQHTTIMGTKLRNAGIPVVDINDLGAPRIDMIVGTSHRAAAEATVAHLWGLGYRSIAYVHVDLPNHIVFKRRLEGFLGACEDLGMDNLGVVSANDVSLPEGRAAADVILGLPRRPQVVLCAHDMVAVGLLQECARRQVKVPEQLAIVGFEDIQLAAHVFPSLTSVRIDAYSMGKHAAECIVKRLSEEDTHQIIDVGYVIVDRESTARRQDAA